MTEDRQPDRSRADGDSREQILLSARVATELLGGHLQRLIDLVARRRRFLWGLVALALYLWLAIWEQRPDSLGNASLLSQGDPMQEAFDLAWTAFAVTHHHFSLFTNWINYPQGENLLDNNFNPLLGIIAMPITLGFGVLASENTLQVLAFVFSAFSMYWVISRLTDNRLAAFISGAFYGFSPYMIAEGQLRMFLDMDPLLPIMLFALFQLLVDRNKHPRRWGVILGLATTAQCFIAMEYAVTTLLVALCGLVGLAVFRRHEVLPALRRARVGLLYAVGIPLLLLSYPVFFMLHGRQNLGAAAHGGEYSADLLGAFFPTGYIRFAPASWIRFGTSFVTVSGSGAPVGDYTENGSYLGFPLVCLCLYLILRFWRDRWVRFLALGILVIYFFTLGMQLQIGGRYTSLVLPFQWLARHPVFNNILPVRMSLLVTLFVALLLGYGLTLLRDSHRRARQRDQDLGGRSSGPWRYIETASVVVQVRPAGLWRHIETAWIAVLVVASCISLIPHIPLYPESSTDVPSYFVTSAVDRIPEGQPVLMYPYPYRYDTNPMLWQGMAGMRFRLIGGYGLFPGDPTSTNSYGEIGSPPIITAFLVRATMGAVPGDSGLPTAVPTDPSRLVQPMRRYLRRQDVGTVVWVDDRVNQTWGQCCGPAPDPMPVYDLFADTLGRPTAVDGPVSVWYDVKQRLARATPRTTLRSAS